MNAIPNSFKYLHLPCELESRYTHFEWLLSMLTKVEPGLPGSQYLIHMLRERMSRKSAQSMISVIASEIIYAWQTNTLGNSFRSASLRYATWHEDFSVWTLYGHRLLPTELSLSMHFRIHTLQQGMTPKLIPDSGFWASRLNRVNGGKTVEMSTPSQ